MHRCLITVRKLRKVQQDLPFWAQEGVAGKRTGIPDASN